MLRTCPACGASVGRRLFSSFWRCDNQHTIYRGQEYIPPRYEIRAISPHKLSSWERKEADEGGFWAVWDLLSDEPWHDRPRDYYAWLISEAEARELVRRLNQ